MMTWVAGVDGCRAGWIAVLMRIGDPTSARIAVAPTLAAVVDAPERPAVVAVDMPIGLPEHTKGSGRVPEQLIRPLLGQRQSSVFAIPSRQSVYAADYGEACALALATSDPPRKVSRQGFGIFPKIREIDALLRARPELMETIFEVHPELAFWALNDRQPLDQPKKVKGVPFEPGMRLRRALLKRSGLLAEALIGSPPPRGAAADDLLDALAGLTVALDLATGGGQSFPDPPGRDAHGLPVAIWTLGTLS
jgi:predicted RNase H-like nuclease